MAAGGSTAGSDPATLPRLVCQSPYRHLAYSLQRRASAVRLYPFGARRPRPGRQL